jgi:2-methylisocitrate lyase-like PEP mutase family enzyme
MTHPGQRLRQELATPHPIDPFLGIYDCFSASIAAPYSPNLFLSGFGFSASYYGLPDAGYIAWSDMVAAASRIRQILPNHKLLVDIDDGYVDIHTATHVTTQLERMGVAMVMLEDQARPRRCGHSDGKLILPLPAFMEKLQAVLDTREHLCVLARTDASGDEIYRRVEAFSSTTADAILVDGIDSVQTLTRVLATTGKPILYNQIAGGKSPKLTLSELRSLGVRLIQYSTPLLFAAQQSMTEALDALLTTDGFLPYQPNTATIGVPECSALLHLNVPPQRTPTHLTPKPITHTATSA